MPEGGLGGLFDGVGSAAGQLFLWQVLGQILSALLGPVVTEVQQTAFSKDPSLALDAATAAQLVVQHIMSQSDAESEASLTGIDPVRFANLVLQAGNTLDLGSVVAAYQRGLIGDGAFDPADVSLHGAMASSGIREGWAPILSKLTVAIPTIAEVMNAWLEGQIDESEARTRYLAAGGDPTWFETSYNANGEAPTPVELLDLVNRGIIPIAGEGPGVVSYNQGFLEGPWRNKWLDSVLALREYYPPPRTVTAMYHGGQLTAAQASSYLAKQGLSADLIAAYLSPTTATTTTAEKTLAKTDILSLYADGLIPKSRAHDLLVAIKYPSEAADELLELQDFKTAKANLTAQVDLVKQLYKGGKATASDTQTALVAAGVPAVQAEALINSWNVATAVEVRSLTAAQIVDLWEYDIVDLPTTLTMLEALGYDSEDAFYLVQIKNKGPINFLPTPPIDNHG